MYQTEKGNRNKKMIRPKMHLLAFDFEHSVDARQREIGLGERWLVPVSQAPWIIDQLSFGWQPS